MSYRINPTRDELIAAFDAGHPIIANCRLGFGLRIERQMDGRLYLEVDTRPGPIRGPAEAYHMQEACRAWGNRLLDYALANRTHEEPRP